VGGAPVAFNFTGNRLLRVPQLSFRVIPGFNLIENRLRVQFPVEYYGDRYADAANSLKLPSYVVYNVGLRYDLSRQIGVHVNAENLSNEIGLTEGNPRSGQSSAAMPGRVFISPGPSSVAATAGRSRIGSEPGSQTQLDAGAENFRAHVFWGAAQPQPIRQTVCGWPRKTRNASWQGIGRWGPFVERSLPP